MTRRRLVPCVAVGVLVAACANDLAQNAEEGVSVAEEAVVSGTPEFDVTWLATYASGTYVDLAAAPYSLYAVRASDGDINVLNPGNGVVQSTIAGSYTNADWVNDSWNLIAASNSSRRIYINAQNGTPEGWFTYPAGVDTIGQLAGVAVSSTVLRVWIRVAIGSTGGGTVLRTGTYDRSTRAVTWSSIPYCSFRYHGGLATSGGQLYSFLDYIDKRFERVTPNLANGTCTKVYETFSGSYTEHGYVIPGRGIADTAAPGGFDIANGYYYILDRYRESDSYIRQTLVRIPLSQVTYP